MRHATLVVIALLSLAACGRGGTAQTQSQGGDPALRAALAVLALERSGAQQLTGDQTRQILPLLKVLRDTSPEDRQVTQAIADQLFAMFTPAQRAAPRSADSPSNGPSVFWRAEPVRRYPFGSARPPALDTRRSSVRL